jgi:hypothetical protein
MIDGAIVGVVLFALGGLAGMLLARYHYLDVLSGQARAIEALEEYIEEHSEPSEASAEDLWGHG